jgi:hypothetical protein
VLYDAEAMRAIDVDEIKTGGLCAFGGGAMPAPEVSDVLFVHRTRLHRIVGEGDDRQMHRPERYLARVEIRAVHAVVAELRSGQRAVFMDGVGNARQHRNVALVPEPEFDEGRDFR